MYGQNQFSQSALYNNVPQYFPNYPFPPLPPPPPQIGNWCYPVSDSWYQGISSSNQEDPITVTLKKREENREIIENFVRGHEESLGVDEKHRKVEKETLKISEAKNTLKNAFRMIESLEKTSKELKSNKALSDEEWMRKQQECSIIEEELTKLFDKFDNNEDITNDLKKRLNQREKKRQREARKRAQWRAEKALRMERRARRHAEADAWIREKHDMVKREKELEHLRKDADIVLSDVRGKRHDARKFLGLLHELQNLRRVKVNIARARGEHLSLAADQAFDNIIDELVQQWSCLDREYSIEEQGLKLMLKADNEEKIKKQKRNTFDDWERALFGRKLQSVPKRGDFHDFMMIRHAWDKYGNLVGNGSRVPIGWVMPVEPSSAAWQKCLKRE